MTVAAHIKMRAAGLKVPCWGNSAAYLLLLLLLLLVQ